MFKTTLENDRLLRLPEVMKLTGVKRSSLYRKVQHGEFPEPLKIGMRAAAWKLSDIHLWIAAPMQYVGRSPEA